LTKLLFGDVRVAKLSWAAFLARHNHAALDRILETLSNNGFTEPFTGGRLFQLFARPGAATGDSAIRTDLAPTFTLLSAPPRAADAPTPGPNLLEGEDGSPQGSVHLGTLDPSQGTGFHIEGVLPADYVFTYSPDLQFGLVYDAANMVLLRADQAEDLGLGTGPNDILELSGDFSAGVVLPQQPAGIDQVVVAAGHDYSLTALDNQVGAGATLVIDAMRLGDDGHIVFDGSAERDGNFVFFGSALADTFRGGAGDDLIVGGGGADTLRGGGGSDTFGYGAAGESSGPAYDTLADLTPGVDHIDLDGTVAGFAAPITSGALSTATFDADLGAALAGLGAAQAAWFAPDAGDLAGTIFLVVDGNGVAGYQPGEDYVFAVGGSPLAALTGHTDIFV
jgi:Ca2+-binding RTX toxin-like protein